MRREIAQEQLRAAQALLDKAERDPGRAMKLEFQAAEAVKRALMELLGAHV